MLASTSTGTSRRHRVLSFVAETDDMEWKWRRPDRETAQALLSLFQIHDASERNQ
jgi:hypothetical protein